MALEPSLRAYHLDRHAEGREEEREREGEKDTLGLDGLLKPQTPPLSDTPPRSHH